MINFPPRFSFMIMTSFSIEKLLLLIAPFITLDTRQETQRCFPVVVSHKFHNAVYSHSLYPMSFYELSLVVSCIL